MEAVIFDMDGVIIDSEPIHYECSNKLLQGHNVIINKNDYEKYIGGSCKEMWREIIDKHSINYEIDSIIKEEYQLFLQYLKDGKGKIKPIEGIKELLETLRSNNVTTALASSSSIDNINMVLDLFDIDDYFVLKVSGFELKQTKPNPEIFIKTATKLNVNPEKCVVIEDSTNGVKAAKAAGMKCIGFKNTNCGNQDLSQADIIVKSIKEIDLKLIKSLF